MASSATRQRVVRGGGLERIFRSINVICLVIVVQLGVVGGGSVGSWGCRGEIGQR